MIFNAIYNPRWADAEHTAVNVTIDTDKYGAIPFTAHSADTEEYGVKIFEACISGVFGEISEYEAPVIDAKKINLRKKTKLMANVSNLIAPLQDAVELGMATAEEKEFLMELKRYRVQLNRIDTGGEAIEWPVPPGNLVTNCSDL